MAEDREIVMVSIPFRKVWKKNEDGRMEGSLSFKIHDCIASVVTEENGKKVEVGSIGGSIGGGYEAQLKDDKDKEFHIKASALDIWNAYCEAIGKPDMKMKDES